MMIRDEPGDIDKVFPRPFSRDMALVLVDNMVPDIGVEAAQKLWDTILAPLYDARRAAQEWPRGSCRRCGVPHPDTPLGVRYQRQDPVGGVRHRMYCPKYVGELRHTVADISGSFGGTNMLCSCGQNYPMWADEDATIRGVCPDILFIWRGPREVNDMGGEDLPILEPRPTGPSGPPEPPHPGGDDE